MFGRGVVRDASFREAEADMLAALKISRQCLLVLLMEVLSRKGEALGSEKGKGIGFGLFYEQKK
jgi:hypothetical protein